MRFVKLAIISVVVLFLLLTAMAALLPSQVRISRAITITGSPARISAVIKDLNTWQQWNEHIKPLHHPSVTATSLHADQLTVTITSSDSSAINTVWQQQNGKAFPGVFSLTVQEPYTVVQWYFDFHFRWYPWEKFSSMIYDKQLGPMMEQSLANLKQLIENTH